MQSTVGSPVPFLKGHGTGNDFVLLPDPEGRLDLPSAAVVALCDRRFGIGADGVLRVVPSDLVDVPERMRSGADWFMDYRNADGSVAEMCGNGGRVFARYLVSRGWVPPGSFRIGTRGGARLCVADLTGDVSLSMGPATPVSRDGLTVRLDRRTWPAVGALVPNPHAIAFVDDLGAIGSIESAVVTPESAFPEGVNIEFVGVESDDHVVMRVKERGVGETLSCGTGACAVAWAHRRIHGIAGRAVVVGVPGGHVVVTQADDGELTLTGPAEIIASGTIDPDWWHAHS